MHSICITIDVEDWFQVENLRPAFPLATWDKQEWRVEANVEKLLEILDSYDCKATFFVLGQVAEKFPSIVKKISNNGHEVASHGYNHELLYKMDSDSIARDLKQSKMILEDISGKEVVGYRAPSFSINDEIIEIIKNVGYRYDSSFNNFGSHDRYGTLDLEKWSSINSGIYKHPNSDFVEIPIQNLSFIGLNLPWGGGGYFRMIPWTIFKQGIQKIIKNTPYIFYMHPWEIDADQPHISEISFSSRVRHYTNLSKTEERLKKMLKLFTPTLTMSELLSNHTESKVVEF